MPYLAPGSVIVKNLRLRLVPDYQVWNYRAPSGATLSDRLLELAQLDDGNGVFAVIGLTGSLALVEATFEELGVAHLGGRHMMIRGYADIDHGIDGEIELEDDEGRATGKRSYLQLKSGDSYVTTRQRDGAQVFQSGDERWATHWRQQAHPVLLVIRTAHGEIRWMDVREHLKRASAGGTPVKQIVFEGERFDVMSVRRWRDRAFAW